MCIEIGVLFSIISVVRVWCDIVVSAVALINNGCRFECLVPGFQDKAKCSGEWDAIGVFIEDCRQRYNVV